MAGPGAKKQTPQPIDRPLSRAYLREFGGWSTAYPPGLSDPTSLRKMENVMINRDGSARVRPGLRYLSYSMAPDPDLGEPGAPITTDLVSIVGTHEAFYLNDGSKAYLFAIYNPATDMVGFRVLVPTAFGGLVQTLDQVFTPVTTVSDMSFTSATTYVKYLQIDNKIFALSNAGEPMRLFTVGANKTCKALTAISKPEWSLDEKLTVVQPDAGWINTGTPTGVRTNQILNPSFESGVTSWTPGTLTELVRSSTALAQVGTYAGRVTSLPTRTNNCPYPLSASVTALTGWSKGSGSLGGIFDVSGGYARLVAPPAAGAYQFANGPLMSCVAGKAYRAAIDLANNVDAETRVMFRFYNSSGSAQVGSDVYSSLGVRTTGRRVSGSVTAPSGAATYRIFVQVIAQTSNHPCAVQFRNVLCALNTEATTFFNGSSGTNYFWTGTSGASASVYHPPADVTITTPQFTLPTSIAAAASAYLKPGSSGALRNATITLICQNNSNATTGSPSGTITSTGGSYTRGSASIGSTPLSTTKGQVQIKLLAVPRGEYHYLDAILLEIGTASVGTYFDGDTANTSTVGHKWTGTAGNSTSTETTYAAAGTIPAAETPTTNTLIHSTAASNKYNFGFFYTFENEVGESAASQITVVRTQRGWAQWRWETANISGEPSGTQTLDPGICADQLVASMPSAVYAQAIAQGAIRWNLYMMTWSDQEIIPVTAIKVATRALDSTLAYGSGGWLKMTPQQAALDADSAVLPSESNRYNYTDPSRGGQGIVAADRMVLVKDPTQPAVIKWTSNQQGKYSDFSASRGGGYKTLTSGNLMIPSCVKLWQNPQSVDTLTILCTGTDGASTGYYMAPAAITSQSEQTNIMGFEETTATPGTTSPYGVEVFNNALYHPIDEQLMKSTANNYNISHKSQTDQIRNAWERLIRKDRIVSSQLDARLYYIVNNPDGEPVPDGCWGNEIWVLDGGSETGTWSRWLIPAQSLRKIEQGGRVYMSVVRPDGIYYLDPEYSSDDYCVDIIGDPDQVLSRPIPWMLETNTQGANRAHDAPAHLQSVNVTLGNWTGVMKYGIRGKDIHGMDREISKVFSTLEDEEFGEMWDVNDFMQTRVDIVEWFFFASSCTSVDTDPTETDPVDLPSSGQLSLVQYRYTPVSVNVGYEFGSVETFDYASARQTTPDQTVMPNGVPAPYVDYRRP